MEQGCLGGNVLACPAEARKGFIYGDDPSVYFMGRGACAPTVSAAFEVRAFLHKLEFGFLDLSLLGF